MKYRLSTLLLLIVIAALALGWYVDHRDQSRRDIIGTWHYPTPDDIDGYSSTLEIRPNGTFSKVQNQHLVFEGNYSIAKDGRIVFHITSRVNRSEFVLAISDGEPHMLSVDARFECRCAVDNAGYLIVDSVGDTRALTAHGDTGIRWEDSYVRQ